MIYRVLTFDCDEEYGTEKTVVEDDQIGDVTVRELEVGSLEELHSLMTGVDAIELTDTSWDRYDGELHVLCDGRYQ